MVKYSQEQLFAALGTPIRRHMMEHLAKRGTMSVSEMAKPFTMSLPAVLKHTQVLEKSGLVTRSKKGRVQYCTINTQAFDQMMSWLLTQKSFWDASFVRLERHITNRKKNNKK